MTPDQQPIQLPPNNLQGFDYVSTRHDALVPKGMEPKHLLAPAFWAHHAVKLRPMDEIRARAEDGTWLATYVVLDCSRTWAKVHQLSFHRLTTADVSLTQASADEIKAMIEAHEVKYVKGREWHVIRKSDRAVLQEHMGDKDAASAWLEAYANQQIGGHQQPAATVAA